MASDHTDREAETYGVTLSKQMCDKPVAAVFWPYSELKDHWDTLELRSWATIDGERVSYQEGHVSAMLHPQDLLARLEEETGNSLQPGSAIMGGTLAAIGGVRPADRFEFELRDPGSGRSITHGYDIKQLPVLG